MPLGRELLVSTLDVPLGGAGAKTQTSKILATQLGPVFLIRMARWSLALALLLIMYSRRRTWSYLASYLNASPTYHLSRCCNEGMLNAGRLTTDHARSNSWAPALHDPGRVVRPEAHAAGDAATTNLCPWTEDLDLQTSEPVQQPVDDRILGLDRLTGLTEHLTEKILDERHYLVMK
jgi:hypothetical protein